MSRTTSTRHNLAGRMGRWSAAHWKTATFGWLAVVIVAFGLGGAIGTKTIDPNTAGPGESGRMDRVLDAGFKQPAHEAVLIQSTKLDTGDRAFATAITEVVRGISGLANVQHVRSPLAPGNDGQIAKGGRAALVEFDIRGDKDLAVDKIGPVLDRVDEIQKAHPELFVGEFGDASAVDGINTAFASDLEKAGLFSLPITLIILIAAFGALVAAGIPLLLGLTAVFGTFGLVALPSHLLPIAPEGVRDGASDRARRRRRLFDVLPPPGARGACRRAKRARCDRGSGSDVRPLRARRGHDRDRGDGGHVPDGRRDLRVLRGRHDPRRRDGDGRIADGAAGAAFPARHQGQQGPCAPRRPPPPRRKRGALLGRDRRPRPAATCRLGRRGGRPPGGARRPGAPAADRAVRTGDVPSGPRRREDVQPHAGLLPRLGAPREGRREGGRREGARRA